MTSDRSIPRLVRRVRVRWDAVRGAHVVLFPEGVLVLNPAAAEVLTRVDGARSVQAIAADLASAHPEAAAGEVAHDVRELLSRVHARGFIEWSEASP